MEDPILINESNRFVSRANNYIANLEKVNNDLYSHIRKLKEELKRSKANIGISPLIAFLFFVLICCVSAGVVWSVLYYYSEGSAVSSSPHSGG